MKKFHLPLILIFNHLLGSTTAPKPIELPTGVPLNYDGSKRSFCPVALNFEKQPVDRHDSAVRLRQLRLEMTRISSLQGPALDGYIITSDDEHQSESVSSRDMRKEYVTGFYGSAGTALVTSDKALLWTDGRYHLQADNQLDCNWMLMKQGQENVPTIPEWLKHEFRDRNDTRIGADPKLVPAIIWKFWEEGLANTSVRLVPVHKNLVDLIWQVDRPNYSPHAAYPLAKEFSGRIWQEKIRAVRLEMELAAADALVITALDDIAWLFNIRGHDLPNTPVLRAYSILTHTSIHLYAHQHKLLRSLQTHLKMDSCFHPDCVKWHNYTSIWYDLRTMSQLWNTVWIPAPCGYAPGASQEVLASIEPQKRLLKASPIIELRAKKNKVEIEGMRRSNLRDSAAMIDFLAYMEEQIYFGTAGWDEMQVARLADEFRLEQDFCKGIAFPTIAAFGAHGALPHYEPSNVTNVPIGRDSVLVVDSGGQYLDGTTDVTRTLHFGTPTQEQREAYTRVLMGSIQMSSLIFPSDLRTYQIDTLAREPLWRVGQDYMHGTGHGIGHFLSVHEPPISVSYYGVMKSTPGCNTWKLKPGFFLSNEPGFYKEGDFGVRLENVMEVVAADEHKGGTQKFLKFREATLVPYDPKLIDVNMLTQQHRRWLNNYNERIRKEVGPELKSQLRMSAFYWMMNKTRSIPEWGPVDENYFHGVSQASPSRFEQHRAVLIFTLFLHIVFTHLSSTGNSS